jgi:hypothetical protein
MTHWMSLAPSSVLRAGDMTPARNEKLMQDSGSGIQDSEGRSAYRAGQVEICVVRRSCFSLITHHSSLITA